MEAVGGGDVRNGAGCRSGSGPGAGSSGRSVKICDGGRDASGTGRGTGTGTGTGGRGRRERAAAGRLADWVHDALQGEIRARLGGEEAAAAFVARLLELCLGYDRSIVDLEGVTGILGRRRRVGGDGDGKRSEGVGD